MLSSYANRTTKLESAKRDLKDRINVALATAYDSNTVESQVNTLWTASNAFSPRGNGRPYCIMQPPPNVTGVLHMGHAFQTALMDAQIRFRRMNGNETLWQPGLDHAGIATQMVVENQLRSKGQTRNDLGREVFIAKVWEWKEQSGGTIVDQFHRLGASADWDRSRFTMDPKFSSAVTEVFVRLFDDGLMYRGERLVNWDPVLKTAVSDVEVNSEEVDGKLWHIRYCLDGNPNETLVVATTRPETIFGDVAVAVNPNDSRYTHIVGKMLTLPLTDRKIPIVADEMVEQDFGTGAVKITPAHDFNDFAVAQRHKLTLINILTEDAHLNENVPAEYRGLDRFKARDKVIAALEASGALVRTEAYTHKVPKGEKTNAVIEPRLTKQWFMKMKPLAEPAIAAVQDGQIKFVPERWSKDFYHWMNNIQDWCVSRQLWWGHRIPVWYDDAGNIYCGLSEGDVRIKYSIPTETRLQQDPDVLDTWFSAGLWPFVTLGWPENTVELDKFFPTDVLVTGFDILFFWVARMIMLSLKFTNKVPFKEVYMTGLLYDKNGKKMSKSKGNVIDPIDLIDGISLEELVAKRTKGLMLTSKTKEIEAATRLEFPNGIPAYGTDALRFALMLSATPGNNVNFDIRQVEKAKQFCNKMWNATKYVKGKLDAANVKRVMDDSEVNYSELHIIDKWMISVLQRLRSNTDKNYTEHRYDLVATQSYEFVWNEFCDWYLEFSKQIMQHGTPREQQLHLYTMATVLESWIKILHPAMPFITEALWQVVKPYKGNVNDTIMLEPFPSEIKAAYNPHAEREIELLKKLTVAIRGIRTNKIPNRQAITLYITANDEQQALLHKYQAMLCAMNKISSINWIKADMQIPPSSVVVIDGIELAVPLAELVDQEKETARLQVLIAKANSNIVSLNLKLNNERYLAKARPEVIEEDRRALAAAKQTLRSLQEQLDKVASLGTTEQTVNQDNSKKFVVG